MRSTRFFPAERGVRVAHAFAADADSVESPIAVWPRKYGIYEGSAVKPVGADGWAEVFRNILVAVGIGRSALNSDRRQTGSRYAPSAQHPLSPRQREIARRHPSFAFFELGPTWRYAQASIR